MVFVPLRFYGPDLDPSTRGVLRDGEGLVPSLQGFAGAPTGQGTSLSAASASVLAAASLLKTDGTVRTFAATATELLERSGDTWADRSKDTSANYTSALSWVFTQLGDQSFATNDTSAIQESTSGAFDDLSGAPRAKFIEAVNNQLFALNTNDGTFGDDGDRWRVSALGDAAGWEASISTQAASGRLTATPGPITGGRRLGPDIVVYKEESIYLGRYSGPPTIWEFELVSDEVGTVSHHSIIPLDNSHAFMGKHDFYLFNGVSIKSIGLGIREEFFKMELNNDNFDRVIGKWDKRNKRLLWFYPSAVSGTALDRYIAYDLQRGVWGPPNDLDVEAAFEFVNPTSLTYDTLGDRYSTYEDLPAIAYDDPFWQTEQIRLAYFDTSHNLKTLDGAAGASSIKIFDFGNGLIRRDPMRFSYLKRVRPRLTEAPAHGIMVNSYRENLQDTLVSDAPTATLADGKFDVERESRWHSVRMDFSGDFKLTGVDIELFEAGDE